MPTWPTSLPEPTRGTLNTAPRENVLAYSGDIGAPTTRRRYTSRLIDYSAQLFLTEAQRQALDAFHHTDCQDGNLTFDMTDWIGSASINCKWTAPPQYSQGGPSGYWFANVSFVKIE